MMKVEDILGFTINMLVAEKIIRKFNILKCCLSLTIIDIWPTSTVYSNYLY